jgi:ribonuclease Z
MKQQRILIGIILLLSVALVAAYMIGEYEGSFGKEIKLTSEAQAAGGIEKDPKDAAPDRYAYYPGSEDLDRNEVRVVACGTGMPAARRGQAATCWLVELGNGEKFFFDIGTGSMANVASLMIPYDYLDKVFLTHLHTDHWGDFDALWAGGWTAGRTEALKVWGPSGATPEMGTKAAIDGFMKTFHWDYITRLQKLAATPGKIEVNEFDYRGENQVVYNKNGVKVRSFPAIHSGDGSVSYSLEWKGFKLVFGGDTFPNKWFIKYAKDADLVVHECFHLPGQMVQWYNQAPPVALYVATQIHTTPQAFGKIMSTIKPRHAVAFHFFNEESTRYAIYEGVREVYDGPLSMATDMMVWNITKDKITERMAVSPDNAWSVPGAKPPPVGEPGQVPPQLSKEMMSGMWDVSDVEGRMVKEFMKKYNLDPNMMKKGKK